MDRAGGGGLRGWWWTVGRYDRHGDRDRRGDDDGGDDRPGGYRKAYARTFLKGQPWRPLAPLAAKRQGTAVTIDFEVPAPPLVLDTMAVKDPGHYGFEFVDGSLNPPAIKEVELTGPSQVTLTLASEPTGMTPVVRYAYTGTPGAAAGATTGPRGNLRDSDATPSLYKYPLYNWAIHFTIAVQ